MWCVASYCTISYEVANLLSDIPPIEHLVYERAEMYWKQRSMDPRRWRKEMKRITKETKITMDQWVNMLVQNIKGMWMRSMIPYVAA